MPKNVRMGPDGVFVANRKVADLGQVVENIARTDVAEIRRELGFFERDQSPSGRRARETIGGVAGFFAGGLIGFVIGDGSCKPHTDCYRGFGGSFFGSVAGMGTGAYLGKRAATHVDDGVIYRAQ